MGTGQRVRRGPLHTPFPHDGTTVGGNKIENTKEEIAPKICHYVASVGWEGEKIFLHSLHGSRKVECYLQRTWERLPYGWACVALYCVRLYEMGVIACLRGGRHAMVGEYRGSGDAEF